MNFLILTDLGEFISNADSTIVMATAGSISSGFNKLQDASWLATGFALGVGSVQLIVSESAKNSILHNLTNIAVWKAQHNIWTQANSSAFIFPPCTGMHYLVRK